MSGPTDRGNGAATPAPCASRLAGGLGLVAGGIGLALLLSEVFVRVVHVEAGAPAAPGVPAELADLPVIESVLDLARPNVRAVNAGVLYRTNSAGMRGGEVSRRPAPGTYRIALAGDSYTMGHRVPESDTYAARAERLLDEGASGIDYEILNLGISGFQIDQVVRRLEWVGLPQRPHLIVYGWTVNDIEGPDYRRVGAEERATYLALVNRFESSRSALLRLVWPRLVVLWSAFEPMSGSYEYELHDNYFENPEAWRWFEWGLDRLAALASERDLCALVFLHPVMHQLRLAHPFGPIYDRVAEAARARGLFVAYAHPLFRGRDIAEVRFSVVDTHPNGEGHRVLAQALVAGIRALPARCGVDMVRGPRSSGARSASE